MIFKTIGEGDTTKVVTALQARKIAQEELNASLAKQAAALQTDSVALKQLEIYVAQGIPYEQAFAQSMTGASAAAKEHAIATKGAAGSTDVFVAKQKAAQTELKATATAAKGTSTAMKALSIAGNMLAMWAFAEGIQLAAKFVDKLIITTEELKEAADNAVNELNNLQSETDSLNQELTTTRDRITELENKPSLSFIEQEELQKLRDASTELERQIELNKTLLNVQEGKARNSALDYLNKQTQYEDYGGWDMSQVRNGNARYGTQNVGTIFQGNQLEVAQRQLQEYENIAKQKENVEKRITSFKIANPDETKYTLEQKDALTNLQLELKSYDSTLKSLNDSLYDVVPNLDTYKNVLNPDYDQSYIDFIDKIIDGYNQLFGGSSGTKTEKFNDIWNSGDFKTYKSELESLAKEGKLDASVLESNEQYKKLLEETGATAEETAQHINSLVSAEQGTSNVDKRYIPFSKTEMISAINALSEGFEELDKIYESISDKNPFDFKLLDDKAFTETFNIPALEKEYSDFIETVSSSPDDINACKDAFNNLVGAWIDSTRILDKVDEGNANVTASMLKMMGVENADILVSQALAERKAAIAWENEKIHATTVEEIQALAEESGVTGQAKDAFYAYYVQKMIAENAINPNGDIEALATIVEALGLATSAWKNYYAAKREMEAMSKPENQYTNAAGKKYYRYQDENGVNHIASQLSYDQKQKSIDAKQEALAAEWKAKFNKTETSYGGGNKSNTSSGSGGSSKKETEEYYDWLSTALEKAASQNDKIREQVDDENNSYSERLSLQQQLLANNQQELELLKIANQRRVEGWESAKQKILETFGEIEGNQLIQNIMSGNSKEGEWFSNIVGDEKKKVVDDAIQANKELEESNDEITEKEKENAEDIQKEFEMRKNEIKSLISEVETAMDSIQSSMSIRETSGSEIITEADYRSLIRQSKEQISLYEEQLDVLYEQRDSLEENSAEWYGIQSEIASVEASINDCKEAQAEWNEEIKKLPVKRIERYLELLENIKKDITNFQAEQDVLGISSTKEQFQELISISEQQIKKLLEQHALLTKNLDTYTYGTDKFNECSNEIQAVEDNISELIQQMREYNNQILQIPISRISELNEQLNNIKDAMSAVSDDYDTTVNTVVDAIDHEIDSLNDLIEAEEKAADDKIKPLQEQLDLLEKQNEAREIELGLEQAQYDLERAKNQKTNKVVRDGEIQYEADQDDIRDAEQNLADKQLEKTKWEIQTQISDIEEARDKMIDGYNTEIDRLTEISKKWEEIKHNIEDSMNAATTTEIIGDGWLNSVLSGNDQDIFDKFVKEFTDIETQKALYEKQIQENERVSSLMQQYIESFNNGSMSYEEVIKQFNALQNAAKDGFSSKEYLDAQLGITGSKDINSAIQNVQNDVLKSYSDFKSYLDVVNANTNTIASYTSTWEQIRDAVVEQLETLKKLAEEEAKKVAAATSSSSSGRKSSGGGSGRKWDSRDENNGPGAEINAKKANGTYSSSSSSSSSSPSGPASDPDLKKKKNRSSYKVGIENGFVGENNTSVGDMIKILALEKLDPDEIPVIAHKREGIFNQEQMETIVGNFKTALFSPTVKTVGTPTIVKQPTNINIEMGDFNLPNVKNGEEFAAYLKQNFALLMKQEISKAFK